MNKLIVALFLMSAIIIGYGVYSVVSTASSLSEEIQMKQNKDVLYYEKLLKL